MKSDSVKNESLKEEPEEEFLRNEADSSALEAKTNIVKRAIATAGKPATLQTFADETELKQPALFDQSLNALEMIASRPRQPKPDLLKPLTDAGPSENAGLKRPSPVAKTSQKMDGVAPPVFKHRISPLGPGASMTQPISGLTGIKHLTVTPQGFISPKVITELLERPMSSPSQPMALSHVQLPNFE